MEEETEVEKLKGHKKERSKKLPKGLKLGQIGNHMDMIKQKAKEKDHVDMIKQKTAMRTTQWTLPVAGSSVPAAHLPRCDRQRYAGAAMVRP